MSTPVPVQPATSEPAAMTSSVGCLLRAFWMLVGNAALFIGATLVFRERGKLGWPDVAFWTVPVLLALARHADIRWYGGLTASGDPATRRDGWRYTWIVLGLALATWAALHWGSPFMQPR